MTEKTPKPSWKKISDGLKKLVAAKEEKRKRELRWAQKKREEENDGTN